MITKEKLKIYTYSPMSPLDWVLRPTNRAFVGLRAEHLGKDFNA